MVKGKFLDKNDMSLNFLYYLCSVISVIHLLKENDLITIFIMELSDKEKKAIMHAIKCMMAADGVIDSASSHSWQ